MSDDLAQRLSKPGFDPEKFVKSVSDGGERHLQVVEKKIQKLADETAVALKKNVYKNYSQFIETAKEISILESEMYQLSHMLTDQKSIIHSLQEMSLIGNVEKAEVPGDHYQEEDRQKNLAFLLEKVEGCASVMEVSGRYLIHSGDLVELDPETFSQLAKVHAFLLNDSLMFATWLPHRRGPVKYKFQGLSELDSLAVVNARDVGGCKNAFKILMFPDTRMFQAESAKEKRMWLDILDETKRKKAALDNQRKEAAQQAAKDRQSAAAFDPSNPFAEPESPRTDRASASLLDQDVLHVEWVQEVPEDLDVHIAQREFEAAVDLVEKIKEYLEETPKGAAVKEYRARIEHRIKHLTEVLMNELQVSPERSIRGGPRVARRAVTQLIRLGKSAQACTLFLKNRSAIIKYNLRQLKIEGNTTLYVKRLCAVFFDNIEETAKEFIKAFPEHYGCFSGFVIWAKSELENFVKVFCTQVFGSKTNFTTVADCVNEAKQCCDKLSLIGLELTFSLELMLEREIRKFIQEAAKCQTDAVAHRAAEDSCKSTDFGTTEALEKFEEDMIERGILDIHNYCYDTCTHLSHNSQSFVRTYMKVCDDLLNIYIEPHQHLINSAFTEIFLAQLRHQEKCFNDMDFEAERPHIYESMRFMVESLFPVVTDKFTDKVGLDLENTEQIYAIWEDMKKNGKKKLKA